MTKPARKSPRKTYPVPRSMRIGTFLLSTILMFLTVWLLGFILRDIGDIKGPDRTEVYERIVDEDLRERADRLRVDIAETEQQI